MDPQRVKAYLQAACAGLGFDIGEVWWTSNENGSSTVASIDDKDNNDRSIRFLQLYTSKSYDDQRCNLLVPPTEQQTDTNKHVLSPYLINAIISSTTQVVWANAEGDEGLLGRSDVCFHTAIAMPVATDEDGNMCIVVMFSKDNVESSDDAMEYLQFISKSAASTIPCLLPVVNHEKTIGNGDHPATEHHTEHPQHHENKKLNRLPSDLNRRGVVARYVSFKEEDDVIMKDIDDTKTALSHELSTAPKDCFGIPMLPSASELGGQSKESECSSPSSVSDAFDEASYGVWSTVMNIPRPRMNSLEMLVNYDNDNPLDMDSAYIDVDALVESTINLPTEDFCVEIGVSKRERLEEFASAFLGMSLFDVADVWMPNSASSTLYHVMSVTSCDDNPLLNAFKHRSSQCIIKTWSGAVGRAFGSGNPVWSYNHDVIIDSERTDAFEDANIQTVLAIPVFPCNKQNPVCVVACYALVKMENVPFVLRFVQQALRLLWDGLDRVVPHASVSKSWKDVGPADLGEMAADLDLQYGFLKKKRPFEDVEQEGFTIEPTAVPLNASSQVCNINNDTYPSSYQAASFLPSNSINDISYSAMQDHVQEAVKSLGQAIPWDLHHIKDINNSISKHQQQNPSKRFHTYDGTINQPSEVMRPPIAPTIPQPKLPTNMYPMYQTNKSGIQLTHVNHSLNVKQEDITQQQTTPPPIQYCQPINIPQQTQKSKKPTGCRIKGCKEPNVSRRPYCTRHSGNRLCEHEGCGKCAQGSTRFCIAHGGGRRCTFPGCDKGARDKFFCAAHGGGKRCNHPECNKSAVGGSKFCTSHGGGKRCAVVGCDKSAQSSTMYCVKHGGGKKCSVPDCGKVARGKTLFCASHGGGVRCRLEGCNRVAVGKLQLCRIHGDHKKNATAQAHGIEESVTASLDPFSINIVNL